MAAVLPEIQALDDVVVFEQWESELWVADTVDVKTSSWALPSPTPDELTCLTDAADEYLEACWADEEEEEEWAPAVKRRLITPKKSKAVEANAWSIDEAVRQAESVDRMRLFARVCNAEARLTALEHEVAALTNHIEIYKNRDNNNLKWRSDCCGEVLARAQKVNFVNALPRAIVKAMPKDVFTTNCDF